MTTQLGFQIVGIVLSLAGIALVIAAVYTKKKPAAFLKNALPGEGRVVDLGVRQPRPFKKRRYSDPGYNQVTIEFSTQTNQIIRGDIDPNLTLFYSGQYKIGDNVKLRYNPENPSEFMVDSLPSSATARQMIIAVGVFLVVFGGGMIVFINIFGKLFK